MYVYQARCNWCIPIVLQSIWCNVCACHSPVYHYIAATVSYLVQRGMAACVVVIWFYKNYRACIFLGWIVSADAGCAGSRRILVKRAGSYEIFTPGIISAFARCNWCVPIILLSIRYNVCACHSPIYYWFYKRLQSLYLSRMNSQHGCWVCWKSSNTR